MCKKYSVTNFLLYISYKTTIFQNIIPKSILVRFWWYFLPTEVRMYVVFCDYFKIFFWSTNFKYSWFKHKLKLFVFKCTLIVLRFLSSKFSFVFNSWTRIKFIDYKIMLKLQCKTTFNSAFVGKKNHQIWTRVDFGIMFLKNVVLYEIYSKKLQWPNTFCTSL